MYIRSVISSHVGYFKIKRMKYKVETPTGIYGAVSGMSNDSSFRFEQSQISDHERTSR